MSILPIFIPHAGCPHQCVFCNQNKISGQTNATVANAQEQIKHWRSRLRSQEKNEAAFYGGSFTGLDKGLQEELLGLTDALLAEGVISSVRCSTRPDYINRKGLRLLKAHGMNLIELGVQSLDDKVLRAAGRGHTAQQVRDAMALLKLEGFKTGIQLMAGLPEQSFESIKQTVSEVIALRPDIARIYPVLVVKDTPLAKAYAEGRFTPLTLEEAVEQSAYMYRQLTEAGIQVIRIGLQADAELCATGNIVAGPFHPSMGELVKSRALRDILTPRLESLYARGRREIIISCPRKRESQLRGMKSCNLNYWQQRFPELKILIKPDESTEIRVLD